MAGDIIPVSYPTNGLDWSNTGHINATTIATTTTATTTTSSYIHIDPIVVPYNPAETRATMLTNDKYLLEVISGNQTRDSMTWTATGIPHNTIDFNYLSQQIMVRDIFIIFIMILIIIFIIIVFEF